MLNGAPGENTCAGLRSSRQGGVSEEHLSTGETDVLHCTRAGPQEKETAAVHMSTITLARTYLIPHYSLLYKKNPATSYCHRKKHYKSKNTQVLTSKFS